MDTFPVDIRFRRPWRDYQHRVLEELKDHLDDRHLHIIAAPGSGKTVLGLEVLRRLNRPALILSPTVAIRDQWVDRFVNLFLNNGHEVPAWISRDLRHPRFLTASTYQGLHSVYQGEPQDGGRETEDGGRKTDDKRRKAGGREDLLRRLQHLGVQTLVLDEAHHLRNEWWKCLTDLKKGLDQPTVVALTATPPFDVSPFEWERYIGLCGPVDAEISVPELVAQKNLCPHQDYVYLSAPLGAEQQEIQTFRREAEAFVQRLCADRAFIAALENAACVAQPQACVEEILDDPPFYASVAFFLNRTAGCPPRGLLRVLGLSSRRCPKLDRKSVEVLLAGCFYTHARSFEASKDLFQRILREAKRLGVADRRTVSLRSSPTIARLLVRSVSKLRSIEDIVRLESEVLGPDLRMVILTDFIRRADFPQDPADATPLKRLGVVPIFEQIRRRKAAARLSQHEIRPPQSETNPALPTPIAERHVPLGQPVSNLPPGGACESVADFRNNAGQQAATSGQVVEFGMSETTPGNSHPSSPDSSDSCAIRLAILSGTLTVIPSESCQALHTLAPGLGIDPADIGVRPLAHDAHFCEITIRGADRHKMVALITGLFHQGEITVLVGTTSLLGEGWDAPSVNALILASFVGSYMLSNQMRGRAIRTQEGNPQKAANIWHLVCQERDAKEFNEDMETLARRFKSFVGVSFTSGRIESGLTRLGLGGPPYSRSKMDHINAVMRQRACDRAQLIAAWEKALASSHEAALGEQVAASELALPREFVFRHTILAVLWQGWFWALSVFCLLMQSTDRNSHDLTLRGLLILMAVAAAAAAVAALPKCLKALWLFLRHGSIAASMKQVGKVVLRAMVQADLIETGTSQLKVVARPRDYGFVACSLRGGTTRERSLFLDALQEVLGPVENPRYVLVRKTLLGWFVRKDYHAVPTTLGKNKDLAEYFRKMWARHVGPAELVYTRTPEGRRFLLKARTYSMAQTFQKRAERLKSWQ